MSCRDEEQDVPSVEWEQEMPLVEWEQEEMHLVEWEQIPLVEWEQEDMPLKWEQEEVPLKWEQEEVPLMEWGQEMPLVDWEQEEMPLMEWEREEVPLVEREQEEMPLVEWEQEEVPLVEWEHLSDTQPLAEGRTGEVRSATLRFFSGHKVTVVLKLKTSTCSEQSVMPPAEALVLQTLAGVAGVPRLYGVTSTLPRILVMSLCPGISVKELWWRGEVRACLIALLHLCPILSEMHERRVCHRDLRGGHNILLASLDTDGDARVHLIHFSSAQRHASRDEMDADEEQVQRLARDILIDMDKAFDPDIFKRLDEALGCLCEPLHLPEISCVLRSLLYPQDI